VYVGHSRRTIEARCEVHNRCIHLHQPQNSAAAGHSISTGHCTDFSGIPLLEQQDTWITCKGSNWNTPDQNDFNRDSGFMLSQAWSPYNERLCVPCPCTKECFILIQQTNKCTFINMSNHTLLIFINLFRSLLWPSQGVLQKEYNQYKNNCTTMCNKITLFSIAFLVVVKYQIILPLKNGRIWCVCPFNDNIIWCFMTVRSTVENQVYHEMVGHTFFLQLFVSWLYSCCKKPWWWSQVWPKHVGEE